MKTSKRSALQNRPGSSNKSRTEHHVNNGDSYKPRPQSHGVNTDDPVAEAVLYSVSWYMAFAG